LLFTVAAALFGYGVAYLSSLISNQHYYLVYLPHVKFDWLIISFSFMLSILFFAYLYKIEIKGMRVNNYEAIIGTSFLQLIFSILFYILFKENFFFLIPILLALFSILLSLVVNSNWFYLLAYILVLLLLVPFYYILVVALTLGALPIFMILVSLLISLLIPLLHGFNRKLV
jgi:hypothetical protein